MAAQADALGHGAWHNGAGAVDAGTLVIDLAGQRHAVGRSDVVTFGRAADILVDESNPYLHRMVGRFFWHAEWWWLENLGSVTELEVAAEDGTVASLPARDAEGMPVMMALAGPAFRVVFESGGASYEMTGTMEGSGTSRPAPRPPSGQDADSGDITLTPDERDLLARLAAPGLRDPAIGLGGVATDEELAGQLGWPVDRVASKLDYLGSRFCRSGVKGVQGRRGEVALYRRRRLAQHVTANLPQVIGL